jgi:hypothetical protein
MEKGEGIELAKKYGIQAYPTLLYLNSSGEVMYRTCGSAPVQGFTDNGKAALDPDKQLATAAKKFDGGKADGTTAFNYFFLLENGCQDLNQELTSYFLNQKQEDLLSPRNWKIIYRFVNDYTSKEFNFLEKNKDDYSRLFSNDSVQDKLNDVYESAIYSAIYKTDEAAFLILKNKIKESGNPNAEKITMSADMELFKKKHDWKNYTETSISFVNKYAMDNADQLNQISWDFYENVADKAMLENALKWIQRSVELEPQYENMDTHAAILYKLGQKEEAKKTAEKAIELAKKNGRSYSGTEELLKKIEKLNPSKINLK